MKNFLIILSVLVGFTGVSQTQITFEAANNNTTVNTCNGFVIDSGGPGGPGYSNGEDVTITICPDTIASGNNDDFISIVFNIFNLDQTDDNPLPNVTNIDQMFVYDGVSTAANNLGNYSGNGLANTTIQATNLNPSGCITLRFVSNTLNAAGNWGFTASATCATPCDAPFAGGQILGGPQSDSIAVCVGDLVDFQEIGSFAQVPFALVDYEWDFMDGTTAATTAGATVQHAFTAPGEYRVNLFVTDDNAFNVCQNANLTDLRVYVATPPTFYEFPSDTTLCVGEELIIESLPVLFDSTWSGFPGVVAIDDGCMYDTLLGVAQVVDLMQTGFAAGEVIDDLSDLESICLDMEHTYMGDLVVQVECPNGTIITLHQQGGGGTFLGVPDEDDDVDCLNGTGQGTPINYCFTPGATDTWVEWVNAQPGWGLTLPGGDYEPIDPLAGLMGCPLNGVWNLIVTDNWGADDGVVFGWGLNFDPALYPPVTEFTPHVGDQADSSFWAAGDPFITNMSANANQITIEPTAAGSYEYTYTALDHFGCESDSIVTITVYESEIVDVLDTIICANDPVQLNAGTEVCEYTINMEDTWGDGWNGGFLQVVSAIGVENYTLPTGTNGVATFTVPSGSAFTIQWFPGAFLAEVGYTVTDPAGGNVLQQNTGGNPPTAANNFNADCPNNLLFQPLTDYVYEWTPAAVLDDAGIVNPIATVTAQTDLVLTMYPIGHPDCARTDDIQIMMAGGLNAGNDSSVVFCKEGAVEDLFTYLGGTPDVGGVWYNPAGIEVTMPQLPDTMANGLYTYEVGAGPCLLQSTIAVIVTQVSMSATIDHSDCQALNGEVTLIANNTMGPVTYTNDFGVTYGTNNVFTQGTLTADGLGGALLGMGADVAGNGQDYNFGIKDSIGCIASLDTLVIDDNFPMIILVDKIDSDCGADNGQVTDVTDATGGTPFTGLGGSYYEYSLDGVNFEQLKIEDVAPGTYTLTLRDEKGCMHDTTLTIESINDPVLAAPVVDSVNCFTGTDGLITINGTNIQSYSIDNGVNWQAASTFGGLAAGTYNFMVASGINGQFCQLTMNGVLVNEPEPLSIQSINNDYNPALTDLLVCKGEEINLNVFGSGGNGTYVYDWTSNGTTVNGTNENLAVTADEDQVICVTMSDAQCLAPFPTVSTCMNITLEEVSYPKMSTDVVDGCYPLEVEFFNNSTSPGQIESTKWTLQNEYEETVLLNGGLSYTYQNPGIFNILMEVTTNGGCVYDTIYTQYLEVYDHPEVNFTYTPIPLDIYDTEAQFIDYSTGNDSIAVWAWEFGAGVIPAVSGEQNPTAFYPEGTPAIYPVTLTVTNEHGCKDSMTSQVEVRNDVNCFAPNTFTPDGDEFNETWRVYMVGIDIYDFHCIVFNRWGETVWESYDPSAEWSGNYDSNNKNQDGTYVWVVNAKDSYNDKKYEFRGTVNIMR